MDLSENVAKILEKMVEVNGLRASRVSRVLEEEIRDQPTNVGFLTLGPKSNHWSRRTGGSKKGLGGWAVDLDNPRNTM